MVMNQSRRDYPKPWEYAKTDSADDSLATSFVQSLTFDHRLYQQDITGSIAHARMLAGAGLLLTEELAQIEAGLAEIKAQIDRQGNNWPGWKIQLEDVHMCIEAALIDKVGDAGRKLHMGRSRNDQVALDLKLWIEDTADALQRLFDALMRALVDLAQRDGRLVMASYTHLQRAQPIVVGGELMAWLSALDRAQQRLVTLRGVDRYNPLGSGAVAGTALPIDRERTAQALSVGAPSANSVDATSNRDAVTDFVYGLAMTAMTLSRWAEQWILYSSSEFGILRLDQRYTTGSSMMPQKRNPDVLELIRGHCGGVYGHLVALLTICKGLPIGYNRDLQLDKQHLFEAYDSVVDCIQMAVRVVATARFDADAARATVRRGFLDATSLAEYLVIRGVPFRTAHQIVGRLVRDCEEKSIEVLSDLDLVAINDACAGACAGRPCDHTVFDWLGAENVVKRLGSAGNCGLSGFEQQLDAWLQRLG